MIMKENRTYELSVCENKNSLIKALEEKIIMIDNKFNILILTVITILAVLFCPFQSKAANIIDQGTCGAEGNEDNVTWTLDNEGVLKISGTGEMRDYNTGLEGTEKPAWYEYRNIVKCIVIDGITTIGERAFFGCKETEIVFLGDSLVTIKECAFALNSELKSLDLPKSLKVIESVAFSGCGNVTGVLYLPELTAVGGEFIQANSSEIHIPGTLSEIGELSFLGFGNLELLVIDEGVERIERSAFSGYNLTRVEFPNTIKYIDDECFDNGLPDVIYGSNAYTQNWAFKRGCKYVDVSDKYDISLANVDMRTTEYEYTGEEIKPDISNVTYHIKDEKCGDVTFNLIEGRDYSVTYKDNVNIGNAKAVITGIGFFEGSSKTANYEIYDRIDKCSISLEYDKIQFDGKEKRPNTVVKYNEKTLVENTDYIVTYSNNLEEGQANVTISGIGFFKGNVDKSFIIYKNDISKANITLSYSEVQYDGSAKEPEVIVEYGGKRLEKTKDYSLEFANNIFPGSATVRVRGNGQYSGVVERNYNINGLSIESADVLLKESIYSYDGSPKTPPVEVKLNGKTLVKDTDYTVTYENNVNDGTAHAVVTGTGIYTDVVKISFVILPYNAGMDAVYPEGTLIDGNFVYGVTDDETNEVEVFCPASKSISKIQIPAAITDENGIAYKVTSIGNKAFYKNTKITSVTIGNNVKSIEDYAFYGCKNIKTIKLGSGVELIGNSSFRKCTKLTSITLPKSIDTLGKNAFYGCSKLKTITINANSVVDVKANAIKGISKKAVIKVPKKLLKKYKKEFNKKSGFKGNMKIKKK